jgi:hypothetical protein
MKASHSLFVSVYSLLCVCDDSSQISVKPSILGLYVVKF